MRRQHRGCFVLFFVISFYTQVTAFCSDPLREIKNTKTELLTKYGECPYLTSILRAVSCVAVIVCLTLTLFELQFYLVARVHDTEERIQGRTMKRIDPCSDPTLFVWSGL